jgi:hypothetical protein
VIRRRDDLSLFSEVLISSYLGFSRNKSIDEIR